MPRYDGPPSPLPMLILDVVAASRVPAALAYGVLIGESVGCVDDDVHALLVRVA